MPYILLISCIFTVILSSDSFANMMLSSDYCELPLRVGTLIMGKYVELDNSRNLTVIKHDGSSETKKDDDLLTNEIYYNPGDKFKISLVPSTTQLIFEVESTTRGNVYFENGKCDGKYRTTDRNPILIKYPKK